jgi:ribonuclease HI
MAKLIICADGACRGNQFKENIGGWGVVYKYSNDTKEIKGSTRNTTNNIMELTAALEALKGIKNKKVTIEIFMDSQYVVKGVNEWSKFWVTHNWKSPKKKPVENKELWIQLLKLKEDFTNIQFIQIDRSENVVADNLANQAMDEIS